MFKVAWLKNGTLTRTVISVIRSGSSKKIRSKAREKENEREKEKKRRMESMRDKEIESGSEREREGSTDYINSLRCKL